MSLINETLPKQDGYRMPGEYEPHAQTWMLWPHRTDTWRAGAKPAQKAFTEVATAISQFEPVTVCVNREQYEDARNRLPDSVRVIEISSNDAWMRDIGPTFLKNDQGSVRGINWSFNSWGGLDEGLYFPWDQDQLVKNKIFELTQIDAYEASHIVLEGGSICVDGDGTVITTEQCILNNNRNPAISKSNMETQLGNFLSIETVIWIENGLIDDETDGHIDEVLFYVKPGEVAMGWTEDINHPQYKLIQSVYEQLQNVTDAKGRTLKIHKLPMPEQITLTAQESDELDLSASSFVRSEQTLFIATYVNCYICNDGVIIPKFNDSQDDIAYEKFQELFPDRKIVQVYTREISVGGGNVHCITQQQPE